LAGELKALGVQLDDDLFFTEQVGADDDSDEDGEQPEVTSCSKRRVSFSLKSQENFQGWQFWC
jgi:hypothetical protein